ncbi:MAG: HD domain-containing protein [Ruminococcaceae bacterium]|nr:HD domain-containing protein [Oscillospiraceae bacterium]
MIYTPMTNKAMRIAYKAHHGQLDYNGIPYIFHPIHLAEQMDDEISCCAALLHDVVEDTDVTMEDLAQEFPAQVMEVLKLLTHDDDVPYFDYVREISKHPVAKKVKLADLAHNSDQTRCVGSDLTEERLAYWKDKYAKAQTILLEK